MPLIEKDLFQKFRVLLLIFAFLSVGNISNANEIKKAESFVEYLSDSIISLVESDISPEQKHFKLEELLKNNASINTISRAALGVKWRLIDENAKREFSGAFTNYLVKKYGKQFDEFQGATMAVERSIDAGKRGILVSTRFIMPGTSPISVKWQVWKQKDAMKLIDIIIENISMLTMEREEIKNRLVSNKGSLDALIAELRSR